jgi:hypothetical protein
MGKRLVRLAGENWRRPGVRVYHEFTRNFDGLIPKPDGGERKQCSNYGDDVTVEEAKRMGGRPCKKCHPPE